MASNEKKISRYGRSGLLRLWNSIAAGDTPEWEAGKAFEYLVLRAFELEAPKCGGRIGSYLKAKKSNRLTVWFTQMGLRAWSSAKTPSTK